MDIRLALLILIPVLLVGSWFLLTGLWARFLLAVARTAAGLRSRSIPVNGARWHYLEAGRGPVLVALHGFGGDADNWFRAAPRLKRHFRIIAPDLPGFGETKAPDELAFDIDSQVERLHDFLRELQVRPAVLAGNSMGGWLAAAYVRAHPETVRGLWLLAPLGVSGRRNSPVLTAIECGHESPLSISNISEFRRRVVGPMFGRKPWIPHPLLVYYGRRAIRSSRQATAQFSALMASPEPLEATVARLELPIHLQWGSLDKVVDPGGAEALVKARPEIDLHVLHGVGHLPMLEVPVESSRLWMAFCRRADIP